MTYFKYKITYYYKTGGFCSEIKGSHKDLWSKTVKDMAEICKPDATFYLIKEY